MSVRVAHLSEIDVKVGQVVGKGTIVGKAGCTGRSTGSHLHYEVRVDGDPLDPLTYIAAGDKILQLLEDGPDRPPLSNLTTRAPAFFARVVRQRPPLPTLAFIAPLHATT